MEDKQVFKQYYSRLAREGIIKSLLCGLIIGFSVNFVIAAVSWFAERATEGSLAIGFWIAIGLGIVLGVGSAVLLYYKVFRPTTKKIARRIDELGLEERLITMTELENDESYIAMRQREDAKEKLHLVNSKSIKFKIAKAVIAAAVIVSFFGLSMTTVDALTLGGYVDLDVIFPPAPEEVKVFVISYVAEGSGRIEGETEQAVDAGEDGDPVIAVPDDGFIFVGWDDDYHDPERREINVQDHLVLVAMFEPIEGGSGGGDPSDGEEPQADNEQDVEPEEPREPSESPDIQPQPNPSEPPPPGEPDIGSGSSRYDPANQIIDGKTPYTDFFWDLYEAMLKDLASGKELTPESRAMLETYLDMLFAGAGDKPRT